MFFGALNKGLTTAARVAGHPALTLGGRTRPRREGVVQRGRWFRIPRAGALALFVPLHALPGAGAAGGGAGHRRHRDPQQPVPAEGDAALLHLDEAGGPLRRAEAPRGLQAPVGHRLPRRPAGRGRGRAARQGGALQGHGAQAHPDRGLPGQQGPDHQHDRGRPQEGGRPDQDRLVLRPRQGAQGREDHQGDAGREGPALRDGQARGEEHRRVRPAALVHHRRRAQGEGPRDRLRRQPGLPGQEARREDEEDQGRRASRT